MALQREFNFIAGTGVSITPVDNATTGRQDVTIAATSGLPDPVTPAHGGTGLTALTAHAVLVGEGMANVALASPGTSGYPLVSNGASADPTFQQLTYSSLAGPPNIPTLTAGAGISVGSAPNYTVTNTAPSVLLATGFTNGSVIGVVGLVVGAAAVQIADTLTMTGLPNLACANIWYSFEALNGPSTGSEITVDCRVDGTTMFTEALTFQTVAHGASFPMGGRWTGSWRVPNLAAGTHTFDMFASCPAGATGNANTQNARIHVMMTTG